MSGLRKPREVVAILRALGFEEVRQQGSHERFSRHRQAASTLEFRGVAPVRLTGSFLQRVKAVTKPAQLRSVRDTVWRRTSALRAAHTALGFELNVDPLDSAMGAPKNSTRPKSLADWRSWLEANHERRDGVWLVTYKRASGKQKFTLDEAVEEALCFGWIDSKPGKLDAERTMLWFAPRKPGSGWSRLNKGRVEALIAAGRMTEAGLARIEAAKLDGSWSKLDSVDALEIPEDLARAFGRHPGSRDHFEGFPRSARRGILEWILQAKRPDTRARRIEATARLAQRNERANQWPR